MKTTQHLRSPADRNRKATVSEEATSSMIESSGTESLAGPVAFETTELQSLVTAADLRLGENYTRVITVARFS